MPTAHDRLASLALVALVATGAAGCGQDGVMLTDGGRATAVVDQEAALWQATKSTCTSYHYDRQLLRMPGGGTAITTVQIVDDVAVLRWYVSSVPTPGGSTTGVSWQETSGEIGIHPEGFAAETVEDLYTECRYVVQNGPATPAAGGDGYDVVTEFNDRGVPLTCLATARHCFDACSSGVSLAGFSCGVVLVGSSDGGSG